MREKAKGLSEAWLAVWIGLFISVLSLGAFAGMGILGWGVTKRAASPFFPGLSYQESENIS